MHRNATKAGGRGWLAPFSLAGIFALGAAATLLWKPPVLLLWNASASVPIGLYAVQPSANLARGDLVIAFAPAAVRRLADRRGYLPSNVPLIKRIAALRGDRLCAAARLLFINGRLAAARLRVDAKGRLLPWWLGCRRLGAGEFLLVGDDRHSFDGRYFGPLRTAALEGKAIPLWLR